MREAIGVDLYNQCTTGKVAKTLNAIKSDADHVPCVLIVENEDANAQRVYKQPQAVIYELSESDRKPDGFRISEARNTGSCE